jgi:hypothetical protein
MTHQDGAESLPSDAEHYERVGTEYDQVFDQISTIVTPYIEIYKDAGVRPEFLAGSTLRFESPPDKAASFMYDTTTDLGHLVETHPITIIWVGLGVAPGEEQVTSFGLRRSIRARQEEQRLSAGLHPVIKQYLPRDFKKYHGQREIDNARLIADTLSRPGLRLMGFEMRPLRRNQDGTIFHLGQLSVTR